MKKQCPVCKGEGGMYDYCGEDYSAMWLRCEDCDGTGEIDDKKEDHHASSTSFLREIR